MDSSTCADEKITESTSIKDKTINSDYSNRSSNISNMSFNENLMNESCNSTKNNSLIFSNYSNSKQQQQQQTITRPLINSCLNLNKSPNDSAKSKIIDQIKENISKNKRDKMIMNSKHNNLSDCNDANHKTNDDLNESKTNTKYLMVGFNYLFLIFCLFYHFIKRTSIKL
jgi:hypothetical protein